MASRGAFLPRGGPTGGGANQGPAPGTDAAAGDWAARVLLGALAGHGVPLHNQTVKACRCLGAFREGEVPFHDRVNRFARTVEVSAGVASSAIVLCDKLIPCDDLPRVSCLDKDLAAWYREGSSDEPFTVDAVLVVPVSVCAVCTAPLLPVDELQPALHQDEQHKSPDHAKCLYSRGWRGRVAEYTRQCSRCTARHYVDHARLYKAKDGDEEVAAGGKNFPPLGYTAISYARDDVEVLRVSRLSYIDVEIVDEVLFGYLQGEVFFYTAALLQGSFGRAIEDAARTVCADEILSHAVFKRLAVWWVEIGLLETPLSKTDLAQVHSGSEDRLNLFLLRGSRDEGYGKRGPFSRGLTRWAQNHRCLTHCGCHTAFVVDAQFDAMYRLKAHSRKKGSGAPKQARGQATAVPAAAAAVVAEDDAPPPVVDEPAVAAPAEPSKRSSASNPPIERSNGQPDRQSGERLWHPNIRRVVLISAAQLNKMAQNGGQGAESIANNLGYKSVYHDFEGIVFTNVRVGRSDEFWDVYFAHRSEPMPGAVYTLSTATITAAFDGDRRIEWEALPSELTGDLLLEGVTGEDGGDDDIVCGVCASGDNADTLLMCEYCECARHAACINLSPMPAENEAWICANCRGGRKSSGGMGGAEATTGAGRARADGGGGGVGVGAANDTDDADGDVSMESVAEAEGATARKRAKVTESKRARHLRLRQLRIALKQSLPTQVPMKIDCSDKLLDGNPSTSKAFSNHVTIVAYPCKVALSVKVHYTGEGSMTNLGQVFDAVREAAEVPGAHVPTLFMYDDACNLIIHATAELARLCRGEPTSHPGWCILLFNSIDTVVDGFHIRGHKERWCRVLLDPRTRSLSTAYNSQSVEQLWQKLVKYVPSLNHMGEGRFKFMLLSMYQTWNMWRASEPYDTNENTRERSRVLKSDQDPGKHVRRAREGTARKQQRLAEAGDAPAVPTPKLKPGAGWVKIEAGRFPVPKVLIENFPQGFDPRLLETIGPPEDGRRKYASVPIDLFRDRYDELLAIAKRHVPSVGGCVPAQAFAARVHLQKWMVDRLVEKGG